MKAFDEFKVAPSFAECALEKAINGVIHKKATKSRPTLSPSGMGCQRAAAFKLSGEWCKEEEETYESNLAAEMGTFIHEHIQKFMSASSIWVDVEEFIRQRPELGITINPHQKHKGEISLLFSGYRNGVKVSPPFSFQCDGIVFIDGEYYIVEIKSESETAWQARTAPNPKHADQATGYAFLYGIRNILWVYASRESFGAHRKIYYQQVDERRISSFVEVTRKIEKAVEENSIQTLPKAKDCRWCAYAEACKALDKR